MLFSSILLGPQKYKWMNYLYLTHTVTNCLYVVVCRVQEVTSLVVSLGTIYHDWGMSFIINSWQLAEYCFGHHLGFIIHIHLSHFLLCNLCTCGSSTNLVQFYISNEAKCMWLRCIHLNTALYFWYHESTNFFIVFYESRREEY